MKENRKYIPPFAFRYVIEYKYMFVEKMKKIDRYRNTFLTKIYSAFERKSLHEKKERIVKKANNKRVLTCGGYVST